MRTRPAPTPRKFAPYYVAVAITAVAGCGDDAAPSVDSADAKVDTSADDIESVDYGEGGVSVRFEPGSKDFLATPWPSDRLLVEGRPDLTTFPNPDGSTLLADYMGYGGEVLDGWGRNSAVYFELSGPLDEKSWPRVEETLEDPRASIQLFNATRSSPDFGRRIPLVFQQVDGEDDPYYPGPTFAMHPVYGFPLGDAQTYCAVLTRALKDTSGRHLSQPPAFAAALESEPSLEPLRSMWTELEFSARDLASATCFTTQDATREMRVIETFLGTRPSEGPTELVYTGKTSHLHEIQGRYLTPNMQSGAKPYRNEGGDARFDEAGVPIVAEDEAIRFRLLIPRNSEMPANGWPVILYSHGTFGDWQTCLDGSEQEAVREGLAMICIDQPLHGERAAGGVVDYLDVFNFINPRSGRMTFRQSAIDTMWLSKMVTDGRFDIEAEATAFGQDVVLDPDNIVFFGHSHGGLAGTIVLAADPRIKGAVLSGASGVLIETILRRKDPVDIESTLALVLGLSVEQLDTFHPIMSLAQTLVDATDPVNYAPYWLEPVTGGNSKHVFMTEGTEDAASPAVGADAVAAAAGLPLLNPVVNVSLAHQLKGLAPVDMPVNSNLISNTGALITGAIRQYEGGDHFVALTDEEAKQTWRGFFRAFREGGVPTIQR